MNFDPVERASSCRNPFVTKILAGQEGATITGVRMGELIEITLEEDQYSGREWSLKSKDEHLVMSGKSSFTLNPHNPQFGMRTFRFDCTGFGPGDIELHEVASDFGFGDFGGAPIPGGKTFRVTVEVN